MTLKFLLNLGFFLQSNYQKYFAKLWQPTLEFMNLVQLIYLENDFWFWFYETEDSIFNQVQQESLKNI